MCCIDLFRGQLFIFWISFRRIYNLKKRESMRMEKILLLKVLEIPYKEKKKKKANKLGVFTDWLR